MKQSQAEILREYGPFPGADRVAGVTYDGQHVWFASGDKLNALFLVGGKLLTAVEISVEAGEANIDGELVSSLIAKYGLMPVSLKARDGSSPANLPTHQLAPGDRLTAVLALADLDRLYRREAKPVK